MRRRLSAILAADVVGYSRLMEADEAGTLARLRALRGELLEREIAARGGRVFKLMGDGLLAEFPSIVEAVAAAIAIQRGMAGREADLAEPDRLRLRIGLHAGDVIADGEDVYGDGVNIAARLEAMAPAGGICISAQAHDAVEGKVAFGFEDGGQVALKNIERPLRVFRLTAEALRAPDGTSIRHRPRKPSRRRRFGPRLGLVAAALALVGAIVLAAAWGNGWFAAPPQPGGRLAVAVLPFSDSGAV